MVSRRQNIVLEDDPGFDPLAALPNLDLLRLDRDMFLIPSQGSASKFSQMTPLPSQGSASPHQHSAPINLELQSSSQSAASRRLPSDFGNLSPLFGKSIHLHPDDMDGFQPLGDDEFPSFSGIGFNFDLDGNLISALDPEPELPPLPAPRRAEISQRMRQAAKDAQSILLDEEEMLFDLGEGQTLPVPDAVLPANESVRKSIEVPPSAAEAAEAEVNAASTRMARSRQTNLHAMLDSRIAFDRREIRDWTRNYAAYNTSTHKQQKTATTRGQAKKNAIALLYDCGVARVGVYQQRAGLIHPLAADFSGISLRARLQGQEPDEVEQPAPKKRGRRRKSEEAFEEEHDAHLGERNTRPRVDEDVEFGRGGNRDNHDDGHIIFDDNSIPEIGMDAAPPMEDRHSSSLMPWSRPGSAVPGSSVRGSAQKSKTAPSPLFSRGSALGAIDRHSDPAEPIFGMDDFGSNDSTFQLGGPVGPLDFDRANNSQLDLTSQNFLEYVTEQAAKTGIVHDRDPKNRQWIRFEELAEPGTHTKAIAAQAFLHVLSLATKNVISVRQQGAAAMEPFGAIRIGINKAAGEVYAAQMESEDELA